jgi:hypothetical protein
MIPADDFRQIWNSQATSKELKGGDEMLATVIERTRNLDRKIAIRNTRECIAGALVAGIFAWQAWNAPSPLERLGMVIVALSGVWVAYYLLRHGGGPRRLDPGAKLTAYGDLLRESYDQQIRLLRSVKYWGILPAYAGILIADIGTRMRWAGEGKNPWTDFTRIAIVTAVFGAYWFVNETYSVPRLQRLKNTLPSLSEE